MLNQHVGGFPEQLDLGRNDAGLALREAGATRITERVRSSLAWRWLLPLCGVASWALPPGIVLTGVSALILVL